MVWIVWAGKPDQDIGVQEIHASARSAPVFGEIGGGNSRFESREPWSQATRYRGYGKAHAADCIFRKPDHADAARRRLGYGLPEDLHDGDLSPLAPSVKPGFKVSLSPVHQPVENSRMAAFIPHFW